MCHHWIQAISCNNQWGCGHIVPVITGYYSAHSLQDIHYIWAWARPIHGRLAALQYPYIKQGMNVNVYAISLATLKRQSGT